MPSRVPRRTPDPTAQGRPAPTAADSAGTDRDAAIPRFLNTRQAAAYLQVNEKKVYALAAQGRIPATKVTGKWLFARDLLDQWLVESSHRGVLADRLIVTGSDDPLLERLLRRLGSALEGHALVSYSSLGTGLGLRLLASARADVCAIHWGRAEESAVRHAALVEGFRQHRHWAIVRAFRREQGLILPRGTPTGGDPRTLLAGARRFALRQEGSGSHRFLLEALADCGMRPEDLAAGGRALSEREAASMVARGEADLSAGARAAAGEFGLGFLALGEEAFDLVLSHEVYFRRLFQRLLEELSGASTRALAARLGGYDLGETGRLVWSAGEG